MVKVNYGALQTMSSTTSSASQGRVAGYQQLISAFSTFSGSDDLQGAGYDAARAYASGIMVSYYQACILYSEAVADAADFLADNYSALCGAESLDEEQLLGEIEGASRLSLQIGASITSLSNQKNRDEGRLSALQTQASNLNDQITKAKEKLENLRKFDSNSASANTEANDAAGRIADAEHTLGVSFAAGTFECTTSTDWADTVATKWEARAVSMQEAYTEALRKFYNGEELTESDLTAIERYNSEYPGVVDQSVLEHVQITRQERKEEMKYYTLLDKVNDGIQLTDEEIEKLKEYESKYPNGSLKSKVHDALQKDEAKNKDGQIAMDAINTAVDSFNNGNIDWSTLQKILGWIEKFENLKNNDKKLTQEFIEQHFSSVLSDELSNQVAKYILKNYISKTPMLAAQLKNSLAEPLMKLGTHAILATNKDSIIQKEIGAIGSGVASSVSGLEKVTGALAKSSKFAKGLPMGVGAILDVYDMSLKGEKAEDIAVKTGVHLAIGYAGGEAGAAIGTLVCPGIGTAVGAVAGGAIGVAGSMLFDKTYDNNLKKPVHDTLDFISDHLKPDKLPSSFFPHISPTAPYPNSGGN